MTELSEDHQNICLEKFLSSVHPTLRGFLEVREPEVTFHDVAYVAQRIELAQNISRVKPAIVNNISKAENKPKITAQKRTT